MQASACLSSKTPNGGLYEKQEKWGDNICMVPLPITNAKVFFTIIRFCVAEWFAGLGFWGADCSCGWLYVSRVLMDGYDHSPHDAGDSLDYGTV